MITNISPGKTVIIQNKCLKTMKAIWNGKVLASSDDVLEIDGEFYFPLESLRFKHFIPSETKSNCPWKGKASYFHLIVNGETNEDAAWYYEETTEFAYLLKNRVAFWKGVIVKQEENKIRRELLQVLNTFF